MKPSQTIFNPELDIVTIPTKEYQKLLMYKELALEMKEVLQNEH